MQRYNNIDHPPAIEENFGRINRNSLEIEKNFGILDRNLAEIDRRLHIARENIRKMKDMSKASN